MKRTEVLEGIRKMRFEEAYEGWETGRLTQSEAGLLLGMCERSFRRYLVRYREEGLAGLIDHRLGQLSHRRAPVDEVIGLTELYSKRYPGWNVKHFYRKYQSEHQGKRSYNWVRKALQDKALVKIQKQRGKHRKRRERKPLPGMMLHQDGSTHEWIPGVQWDLIATMDDATSEVYSLYFVEEEGTASSMMGIMDVIETHGLFCSFYSDRGSHYWTTPEAGGRVDKHNLTQFGRAMKYLGIDMIAAYSPEARGRSERLFRTLQGRLPNELALANIVDMEAANHFLKHHFLPTFNAEFKREATEVGSAFVPYIGLPLKDIFCIQEERVVGKDNCVRYANRILQIPADRYRYHYVKTKVKVFAYLDGTLAIFHGPRCLAHYDAADQLINIPMEVAA